MRWQGILSVAASVSLTPVLAGAGCVYDNWTAPLGGYDIQNNVRGTFMATHFGKTTKAVLIDQSKADFDTVSKQGQASFDIVTEGFHDIKGMTASGSTPGLYFNADATAVVMPQPDADGNGRQDTFFIATEHNLPGQRHERALVYGGPFTPFGVLQPYTQAGMKATYTGKAGISGTVGSTNVSAEGPLTMRVNFGSDASIHGEVPLTGVPHADGMSFSGNLTSDLTDFRIKRAVLNNGGTSEFASTITNVTSNGEGVGSFIGDKGQGTIGAFSISDTVKGTSDIANLQGWFIGSADSLK